MGKGSFGQMKEMQMFDRFTEFSFFFFLILLHEGFSPMLIFQHKY